MRKIFRMGNIKYIFIPILFCISSISQLFSQGKWECLNPWPISFPSLIWPINERKVVLYSNSGNILISEDGGASWSKKDVTLEYGGVGIWFSDTLNGCIINLYNLFKTEDGGYTWKEINTGLNSSKYKFIDVKFINKKTGFFLSGSRSGSSIDIINNPGLLYKTENGGNTWNKTNFSFSGNAGVISYFDEKNIFILCLENGIKNLYKSKDGGITFYKITGENAVWNKESVMQFQSPLLGWIGKYKTTDGGITWEDRIPSISSGKIRTIYFTDTEKGWAISDSLVYCSSDGGNNWSVNRVSYEAAKYSPVIKNAVLNKTGIGWAIYNNSAIFKTADFGKNWRRITKGNTNTIYGLDFIDESRGWAVDYEGLILNTTDGGNKWNIQTTRSDINLFAIKFVDKDNGWAVGNILSTVKTAGVILNTKNGGDTWNIQYQTDQNKIDIPPMEDVEFRDLFFLNNCTGWAIDVGGKILKTEDGGEKWESLDLGGLAYFMKIFFIDSLYGWLGNKGPFILATTDGGKTWNKQLISGIDGLFNRLQFVDRNYGWAASLIIGSPFYRTTNGGKNWIEIPYENCIVVGGIKNFFFFDKNNGIASGLKPDISITTDGGQTWQFKEHYPGTIIQAFKFFNKKSGWAAGNYGSILRYTETENPDYIRTMNEGDKEIMFSSFPNPFNSQTTINYKISFNQDVNISIYNIVGQKLETINKSGALKGMNTIRWNADKYPSGIYLMNIHCNEYTKIIKCVLIK